VAEVSDDTLDLRDGDGPEIDLRDGVDLHQRLRFAAGSLAADFSGEITIALAEELIFNSAEGLLAAASITDFVPILAERRARRAVRSGVRASAAMTPRPPSTAPAFSPPSGSGPAAPAAPLLAVPEETLNRLRDAVEQVRKRVAGLTDTEPRRPDQG
jgi:hypothetical protein